MRIIFAAIALIAGLGTAGSACAHGGGLNKDGCHTNRKTGEYHCHRNGAAAYTPRKQAQQQNLRAVPATAPEHVFANCAEARAAGAAPVRRGDPGYGPHLDRDNDGVGCEPWRGR